MSYLKRLKDKTARVSAVSVGSYPQECEKSQADIPVQVHSDRMIDSVDALNNHIRTCTEGHTENSPYLGGNTTAETTTTVSVVSVGSTKAVWPARPAELASWPIDRRLRWVSWPIGSRNMERRSLALKRRHSPRSRPRRRDKANRADRSATES